jgi:hypothetical protein
MLGINNNNNAIYKKANNKIFQQTLQIVTTDYRVCHTGESGSHGMAEKSLFLVPASYPFIRSK